MGGTHQVGRLGAIVGATHDFKVGNSIQKGFKSFNNHRVIIDENNPDRSLLQLGHCQYCNRPAVQLRHFPEKNIRRYIQIIPYGSIEAALRAEQKPCREEVNQDSSSKYEFTEAQNDRLTHFVSALRAFSYLVFLGGACYSMALVTQALDPIAESGLLAPLVIVSVVASLAGMWLGIVLLRVAESFKKIVETEGRDVAHLLEGLLGFGKFFRLATVVLWVMCLSLLTVGVFSLT